MLWSLLFAALAAIAVVISTRMVVVRTDEAAGAQKELSDEKERLLRFNLAEKQANIANLNNQTEALKQTNLLLSTRLVTLQNQSEARRLTGAQQEKLAGLLKGVQGGLAIVSPMADGEASDFADDFDKAIHNGAGWDTLRIKNRITEKYGLSLVTAEGTPPLNTLNVLGNALRAIGISYNVATVKDGDASTSPHFQAGYLYLVVEHKPLPKSSR